MAEWLLISYHVPSHPSAVRVATWRALKQIGAVALGDGLYALPATPGHESQLLQVSERIAGGGGSAISFRAAALTPEDENAVQQKFLAARHDEYLQVAKSANKLVDHIGREEATEDYRFAEVESLEEELEKVRRQLDRVIARDHLALPVREQAEAAIREAESRLQDYFDHAYRRENQE